MITRIRYDKENRDILFEVEHGNDFTDYKPFKREKTYGEVNYKGETYLLVNRPGISRDSYLRAEAVKVGEEIDGGDGYARLYAIAFDIDDQQAMSVGMSNLNFFETDNPIEVEKSEVLYNFLSGNLVNFYTLEDWACEDDGFDEIIEAFKNVRFGEKAQKMAAAALTAYINDYQNGIFSYWWEMFSLDKHKKEIFEDAKWFFAEDDNSGNQDEPDLTRITQNSVIEAIKKVQDEFQV